MNMRDIRDNAELKIASSQNFPKQRPSQRDYVQQ